VGTAVGIVFDPLDAAGDAVLVTLEIDDAIVVFMTTTTMTGRNATPVVTPTRAGLFFQQRRMGLTLVQLGRANLYRKASAGRGGLEFLQCHLIDLLT
jgi:hypothetical protein